MLSSMQPAPSAFLKGHRCQKILSSVLPSSICLPWPCWIEMAFTARRGFIPLPANKGCSPILEQKLQCPAWADGSHLLHGYLISRLRSLLVSRCSVLHVPGIRIFVS